MSAAEYQREWRARNLERAREYQRTYHLRHLEADRERKRIYMEKQRRLAGVQPRLLLPDGLDENQRHAVSQQRYRQNHADYAREWWHTEAGRANRIAYTKRWRTANPEKHAAHVAVSRAVRSGLLKKEPCFVCKAVKVEGHHFAGYDRENRLRVRWLCNPHHREAHSD